MDGLRQTLQSAHILSTYNLLQPGKNNYTTYCRLKLDNRCKKIYGNDLIEKRYAIVFP